MLMGDYYRKKDITDRALEEYREGLARTQDREVRLNISKKVVDLAPEDIETRFTLATIHRDRHVYDLAIEQYRKILDISEDDTEKREAYLGLGESYLKKTDYKEAKEYFDQGLKLAETSVQRVSFYEGLLKADEGLNGKDELSDSGKRALLNLAEINANQGSQTEAKNKLERLADLDPEFKKDRVQELLDQVTPSGQSNN